MSTSDYRRLAETIRQQYPAPKGSDAIPDYTRAQCMRALADAYDTLPDELDAAPKWVDVLTDLVITHAGQTED